MTRETRAAGEKPLVWIRSAKPDFLKFPQAARTRIGRALEDAQFGGTNASAKPLHGLGSGVFEIVEDYDRATYRVVYTVRFPKAVFVLHAFQKKSTKGISTPERFIRTIRERLKTAQKNYEEDFENASEPERD